MLPKRQAKANLASTGSKHADLYQLLAYCVATRLPRGMLIYAAGVAEPVTHRVLLFAQHSSAPVPRPKG